MTAGIQGFRRYPSISSTPVLDEVRMARWIDPRLRFGITFGKHWTYNCRADASCPKASEASVPELISPQRSAVSEV